MSDLAKTIEFLNDHLEEKLPDNASETQIKKALVDKIRDMGSPEDECCHELVIAAIEFALIVGKRIKELEPYFVHVRFNNDDDDWDYNARIDYAEKVIDGRWPALEKRLLWEKHAYDCTSYAIAVLKKRWKEAERWIFSEDNSDEHITNYIQEVKMDTFPPIDSLAAAKKNPTILVDIAEAMWKRWPEAEKYIKKADHYDQDKYLDMCSSIKEVEQKEAEARRLKQEEEDRLAAEEEKRRKEEAARRKKLWKELASGS